MPSTFRCYYCGDSRHISEMTRDHVTPKSKGGKNKPGNIVRSCFGCNQLKGAMLPGEFRSFVHNTVRRLRNPHPQMDRCVKIAKQFGIMPTQEVASLMKRNAELQNEVAALKKRLAEAEAPHA